MKYPMLTITTLVTALGIAACNSTEKKEEPNATIEKTVDAVEKGAETAVDATKDGFQKVKEGSKDTFQKVKEATKDAVKATKEKSGDAADAIEDGYNKTLEKMKTD